MSSVPLFLMHGHSFEWIWTKFGTWHPYTLWMVMGWLASAAHACRLAFRALSIYTTANGWRAPLVKSELAGGKRSGWSAAGARSNQAPLVSNKLTYCNLETLTGVIRASVTTHVIGMQIVQCIYMVLVVLHYTW